MEYILSSVFVQTLIKHGFGTALLALAAFALVAVAAYYAKARIDLMRQEAQTAAEERLLERKRQDDEIRKRDEERARLVDLLEKQSADIVAQMRERDKLLGNHLAHAEASNEKLVVTLSEIGGAMRETATDLRALREDGARRSAEAHEDMAKVQERLTAIEVMSSLRKPGAST